jgi:hypothetical protein
MSKTKALHANSELKHSPAMSKRVPNLTPQWPIRPGSAIARIAAAILTVVATALPVLAQDQTAGLRWRVGGGNIVTHLTGAPTANLYTALRTVGAKLGRMDSYGWRNDDHKPTPHDFDAAMMEAYRHGITPIILLEYEGAYQKLDPPQLVGTYAEWFTTGATYARRFQPDGEWGREHGISGFGARIFTAINEPDIQASIPKQDYHDALAGFADGIHSVNAALKVVPGGFATCNSNGDPTLGGYGTAIADLLQSGQLDGIDLHTYYNARWFPLTKDRFFSAQGCFDRVKQTLGITRDINFYATEFNIARDGDWTAPDMVASLFLTAVWDHLGVVGNQGRSATVLAFPWNFADTGRIEGPAYAMAARENPWAPDGRSRVMQMVLSLAGDMQFTKLDPLHQGVFELAGDQSALFVWQNRTGWTDRPGQNWTVKMPDWAKTAELWGWNGLRHTFEVKGRQALTIRDLTIGETYMIRVR